MQPMPALPRANDRFSSSLAISVALHAAVLLWFWLHRPVILEVSLPGSLSVDLVGAEAPASAPAPASKQVTEAPPQPIHKDEVATPARKPKSKPLPQPAPPAPRHAQTVPAPHTSTAPAQPSTGSATSSEAHIGLSGAPGVASDFPFSYYLISVRNLISKNWIQPGVERRTKTTLFFRIAKDGSVTDARVEIPSGTPPFDQAALRAVLASSPLPPLPQGFNRDELGVHFDFEVSH